MAACEPRTFEGVTEEVFRCLRTKLESIGYELQGSRGTIHGPMGIVIEYSWDEDSSSLFTHIQAKNFLLSCGRINSELEKAIESCQ